MKKYKHILIAMALPLVAVGSLIAGNPDRQGEAGAYELTINPWARGASYINCSRTLGVEATYLNPAGVGRLTSTELVLASTSYLRGTGITYSAAGFGLKLNETSAVAISVAAMDFGELQKTTVAQPEGTGATFRPLFTNIGISYAYTFEKRLSVGATVRVINQSIADVSASAVALDAGVMYTTGPKDNIHFAVSLKNVGSQMKFDGDGLSYVGRDATNSYPLTVNYRARGFELPSSLNIGAAYDINFQQVNRITLGGNFTANSFSRDELTGNVEYAFRNMFMARVGYSFTADAYAAAETLPAHTGLVAGISILIPTKKEGTSGFGIDYGFRATNRFAGSHTLGLRLNF